MGWFFPPRAKASEPTTAEPVPFSLPHVISVYADNRGFYLRDDVSGRVWAEDDPDYGRQWLEPNGDASIVMWYRKFSDAVAEAKKLETGYATWRRNGAKLRAEALAAEAENRRPLSLNKVWRTL